MKITETEYESRCQEALEKLEALSDRIHGGLSPLVPMDPCLIRKDVLEVCGLLALAGTKTAKARRVVAGRPS